MYLEHGAFKGLGFERANSAVWEGFKGVYLEHGVLEGLGFERGVQYCEELLVEQPVAHKPSGALGGVLQSVFDQ